MASYFAFPGPVDPPAFSGRNRILKEVFGRIENPELQSSSLVGGPRTGKTSLLRFIASARSVARSGKTMRVYVDAEPMGLSSTPTEFWYSCLRALSRAEPPASVASILQSAMARAKGGALDVFDLEDLFDSFASAGRPVVIAIDNFESLLANPHFWPPQSNFFHVARSLAQRLPHGLAYVTATSKPLLDLWDSNRSASPYYNIFANISVAKMDDEDIADVVAKEFASVNVGATNEVVELVTAASDRNPAMVRFLARHLAECVREGMAISQELLLPLFEDPDGPFISLNRQIRAVLDARERQILDEEGKDSPQRRALVRRLAEYGLLPLGTEAT